MNETIETFRMIQTRAQLVRFEIEALGGTADEMATAGEAPADLPKRRGCCGKRGA